MTHKLVDHHFAVPGLPPPEVDARQLVDYLVGANGTFARSRRPGLAACVPVTFNLSPVRGLAEVESYVRFGLPRVPASLVAQMLTISRGVCGPGPAEALFHLRHGEEVIATCARLAAAVAHDGGWLLEFPEQRPKREPGREADSVEAVGPAPDGTIIEVHSHHSMRAEFSPEDNEDEGGLKFRVFAVLGTIFERPTIRARVGVCGHFYELPAATFFELPEGLTDCVS